MDVLPEPAAFPVFIGPYNSCCMKKHNPTIKTPLPIFSNWVKGFEDLIEIQFPSEFIVLFLCADFSEIEGSKMIEVAKQLILKGVHYVCCWGKECEFAHDCFDEANVYLEIDDGFKRHVMSTWHSNESIDEALWFSIFNAIPEDEYLSKCSTYAVGVGEFISSNILIGLCNNIEDLNERIINT